MTSTRPHLRRRRIVGSALAAAVLFAGAMSACSPSPSTGGRPATPLSAPMAAMSRSSCVRRR